MASRFPTTNSTSSVKSLLTTFQGSISAGLFIGLAGTVFLSCPNKLAGAFLFGFGLLTIVCCGFKLYTGAIGYLVLQGRNTSYYLLDLLIVWLGNFIGTFLVGTAIRFSRVGTALAEKASTLCQIKMADSPMSLLLLSFFCGILMFTAVDTFKREEVPAAARVALVILCVMVFILSGFEHCIANMYYFSVAGMWNWSSLCSILLMTAGNSLGGFTLPLLGRR